MHSDTKQAQLNLLIEIQQLSLEKALRVGCAESCTGGLIAAALTSQPGSSQFFMGAIVAYDNELKRRLLGVCAETLRTKGAVSEAVACQMAEGAMRLLMVDIGIGITGIAGPGGASSEKPIGTVWLALAKRDQGCLVRNLALKGTREQIRQQATYEALKELYAMLK